ncbi:MAG: hypothetical protein OEO83_01425 [Alphaproteobacteria bacterium]|nr:hypothetical protein [Alphaproteobacteria bacterium]
MRTYEELTGARGSRVFYRAERFRARDLFARTPPLVAFGDTYFQLDNLSMTGLAATRKGGVSLTRHAADDVAIIFEGDNKPLFSSKGRLERLERDPAATRIALSFTGAPLDIPELVCRYNESLLRRDLNGGLHHAVESVAPDYRRHCVDVLHLLRRYRSTLEQFENNPATGPDRSESLFDLCEQRMLPEWRQLWRAGNELVRPLVDEPELMQAAKDYTEQVLTPDFLAGPLWDHSYRKPFGYPGDFQLMGYVYDWRPRGKTVYEKLLDRMGLELLECIATRMMMVQQEIAHLVAAAAPSRRPFRILNLGCGSAREISNYLDQAELPCPVEITLVDQDERALSHAYEQSYPKIMNRGDGSSLRCLQISFVEFLKFGRIFQSLPPQDFIYSMGLMDYLTLDRARCLATAIYAKLAPGARMVIGNIADVPEGLFWPSEFISDWSMRFRTEADLLAMTGGISETAPRIVPDPTGKFYLIYIDKLAVVE